MTDTSLLKCSGCRLMLSSESFNGFKICEKCRNRKKPIKNNDKCLHNNCKFDQIKYKKVDKPSYDLPKVYASYCGKHQVTAWLLYLKENNKKPCYQYNHFGCRTELDTNYPTNSCEKCLSLLANKDRQKRENVKNQNDNNIGKRNCTSCFKEYELDIFMSDKKDLLTNEIIIYERCLKCREAGKRVDDKRIDRVRNYSAYESRLEVKERRKAYRQMLKETNPEHYKMYTILHRMRLREMLGDEKYLALMAKRMKKYLDENPEMRQKQNDRAKLSLDRITYNYIKSAEKRNIDYKLTDENAQSLMDQECFYCKDVNDNGEKYFNGIDRMDNNVGYNVDNCVTCCKTCNYSKCEMSLNDFIGKVHHIISYLGLIDEQFDYSELFKDHNYKPRRRFYRYKIRANKKSQKNNEFIFDLSNEEFTIITSKCCYLCGKESDDFHTNGIDRINNNVGYEKNNVLPCCGDCNFLKRDFSLNHLLIKYCQIYYKRKLTNDEKSVVIDKISKYISTKVNELNKYINNNIKEIAGMMFDMYISNKTKNKIESIEI